MKTLYQNPWFRVVQDGRYHYVVEENGNRGAAILPLVSNREVLLLRVQRSAHNDVLLEIPRGCADDGESSLLCAQRELAEETGYSLPGEKFERLGRVKPNSAILASTVDLYLAHIDEHLQPTECDDEADEVVLIPLPRLRQMLRDGQIEDSFTLAALALYLSREDS